MYKIFLQIEKLPRSLNKKVKRSAFWENIKENKMWDREIALLVAKKKPMIPLSKANITLIRHSYRQLDFDGLVGSMKPVVDALVTAGVLKDDSWAVTGHWNVTQRFRSKKDGPLLEILVQARPDSLT